MTVGGQRQDRGNDAVSPRRQIYRSAGEESGLATLCLPIVCRLDCVTSELLFLGVEAVKGRPEAERGRERSEPRSVPLTAEREGSQKPTMASASAPSGWPTGLGRLTPALCRTTDAA